MVAQAPTKFQFCYKVQPQLDSKGHFYLQSYKINTCTALNISTGPLALRTF